MENGDFSSSTEETDGFYVEQDKITEETKEKKRFFFKFSILDVVLQVTFSSNISSYTYIYVFYLQEINFHMI